MRSREFGKDTGLESIERTDEELLLAYRDQGDSAAFAQLYRRYQKEIFVYLWRFLRGNTPVAEDAMQQTFFAVAHKSHMFDSAMRFKPWLYTIASNQARDFLRRGKRHVVHSLDQKNGDSEEAGSLAEIILDRDENAELRMEVTETRTSVRAAVAKLPPIYRDVVRLIYLEDYLYREAADYLDIPVGTVKSRLCKALELLRKEMKSVMSRNPQSTRHSNDPLRAA